MINSSKQLSAVSGGWVCCVSAQAMVILHDLGTMISIFLNLKNTEQNVKLSLVFFIFFKHIIEHLRYLNVAVNIKKLVTFYLALVPVPMCPRGYFYLSGCRPPPSTLRPRQFAGRSNVAPCHAGPQNQFWHPCGPTELAIIYLWLELVVL